jgi:hypothetical protein
MRRGLLLALLVAIAPPRALAADPVKVLRYA